LTGSATSLEKRLRDTSAIGVFTKLALKNEVDDLLNRFRAFHAGRGGTTLGMLRESFDLLVLKVVSLLQDKDALLARDISTSREALWNPGRRSRRAPAPRAAGPRSVSVEGAQ
jgi:hypothetical protein